MEQEALPGISPGDMPCAFDREVFERVWRRVMPEDRPDCPFVLDDSAAQAQAAAPAQEQAQTPCVPERTALAPVVQPAPVSAALPQEDCAPCLGAASAVYGALLQQFIDHELADFRTYQMLARRAIGTGGKVLASIASDERRHAKRLSTAYFLISGVRYWPIDRMNAPMNHTYPAALRERFGEEQRGECAYLAAAEETTDPALQELFQELAGDENAHAWLLRGILEQL